MIPLLQVLGGASAGPLACTYVTTVTDAANLTTYTLTGVSIGAASADRTVALVVASRTSSGYGTISSVTIGGVAASLSAQQSGPSPLVIARAAVPTGTTADIVVTVSAAALRCGVAVFAITGGAGTIAASTANISTSATVSSPAGGVVIAAGSGVAPGTSTWTGVTKRFESAVEAITVSGGETLTATAQSVTGAVTWTGGTEHTTVAAAFTP